VDLMWHTHQCHPAQYRNYGLKEFGRIVNHDDSIESKILSTAFSDTAKLWKRNFGETYSAYIEESKWFRQPKPVAASYGTTAAANAVTITRPTRKVPQGQGGCTIHDPTPMLISGRRSLIKFPLNAKNLTRVQRINGPFGANAAVLIGGCYTCAPSCGNWGVYGEKFHPWGTGKFIYGATVWGGCGGSDDNTTSRYARFLSTCGPLGPGNCISTGDRGVSACGSGGGGGGCGDGDDGGGDGGCGGCGGCGD
ncbi:hypothetical protein HDU99_001102, partial [Rhizoclosmatium hyalinum]